MSIQSSTTLSAINRWSSIFFQKRWVLTVGAVLAIAGLVGEKPRPAASVAIDSSTSAITVNFSAKTTLTTLATRTSVSLANSANITSPSGETGLGTLKVINGTYQDAAIKLVDHNSGKTYRFVYIRANHDITLNGIGSCLCTLKFTTGKDWDSRSRKFRRNSSFSKFEQTLNFREARTASGVRWMNYTATLHPVANGKARTSSIRERDF